MSKLLVIALAAVSFSFVSCQTQAPAEFSPRGPVSDKADLSWNRPEGPEGAGILGSVLQ